MCPMLSSPLSSNCFMRTLRILGSCKASLLRSASSCLAFLLLVATAGPGRGGSAGIFPPQRVPAGFGWDVCFGCGSEALAAWSAAEASGEWASTWPGRGWPLEPPEGSFGTFPSAGPGCRAPSDPPEGFMRIFPSERVHAGLEASAEGPAAAAAVRGAGGPASWLFAVTAARSIAANSSSSMQSKASIV